MGGKGKNLRVEVKAIIKQTQSTLDDNNDNDKDNDYLAFFIAIHVNGYLLVAFIFPHHSFALYGHMTMW